MLPILLSGQVSHQIGHQIGNAVKNYDFAGNARDFIKSTPGYGVVNTVAKSALGAGSSAYNNAKNAPLDEASLLQSLDNIMTGSLDYSRSLESAMRAERFSAREAEKTRRWQEHMSNTAYSRAIADLKRNGINPYAIGYFSPASTPAGATGSAYNTSPHSASSSALSALGMVERAYNNTVERAEERKFQILKILVSLFGGK